MIGLTDQLKNDFRVMKEIGEHTRLKPNVRQASIDKFIAQFKENESAVKIWASWGLKLAEKNLSMTGRVLPPVTLFFGRNRQETVTKGDWGRAATSGHVLATAKITRWALIYPEKSRYLYSLYSNP